MTNVFDSPYDALLEKLAGMPKIPKVRKPTTLARTEAAMGSGAGAVVGGVSGAVTAQPDENGNVNRLSGAVSGAMTGAVVGSMAAPALGKMNRMRNINAGRNIHQGAKQQGRAMTEAERLAGQEHMRRGNTPFGLGFEKAPHAAPAQATPAQAAPAQAAPVQAAPAQQMPGVPPQQPQHIIEQQGYHLTPQAAPQAPRVSTGVTQSLPGEMLQHGNQRVQVTPGTGYLPNGRWTGVLPGARLLNGQHQLPAHGTGYLPSHGTQQLPAPQLPVLNTNTMPPTPASTGRTQILVHPEPQRQMVQQQPVQVVQQPAQAAPQMVQRAPGGGFVQKTAGLGLGVREALPGVLGGAAIGGGIGAATGTKTDEYGENHIFRNALYGAAAGAVIGGSGTALHGARARSLKTNMGLSAEHELANLATENAKNYFGKPNFDNKKWTESSKRIEELSKVRDDSFTAAQTPFGRMPKEKKAGLRAGAVEALIGAGVGGVGGGAAGMAAAGPDGVIGGAAIGAGAGAIGFRGVGKHLREFRGAQADNARHASKNLVDFIKQHPGSTLRADSDKRLVAALGDSAKYRAMSQTPFGLGKGAPEAVKLPDLPRDPSQFMNAYVGKRRLHG